MTVEPRRPLQPGDRAPDFALPSVEGEGIVSLSDYRGRSPLLLGLFRGLYCAFCRRHIAQLGITSRKLQALGVEVLAIVAAKPERARLYYRFRPVGVPLAADPDLTAHRAYGVPNRSMTPEIWQVIASKYVDLARELKIPATDVAEIKSVLSRQDRFEPLEADQQDMQRHGAQLVGQFLVDQEGIVRWASIECGQEGLAGMEKFPTDEEFLAAARAHLR